MKNYSVDEVGFVDGCKESRKVQVESRLSRHEYCVDMWKEGSQRVHFHDCH